MRINKAGHDNTASRIDLAGAAYVPNVRFDITNLVALDEDIGLRKVADLRIHRHHGAAANYVATAGLAGT